MKLATATAVVAAIALAIAPAIAAADVARDPEQTLQYRVAWNGLAAARASVHIRPDSLGEHPTYTVETSARTNSFIDLFFQFRGRARVIFLQRDLTPLQFYYDREIRGVHARTTVDYLLAEQRIRSHHVEAGVTKSRFNIPGLDLIDPITATFHARHSPSQVGKTKGYDVFTGESRYRVELTPEGRDEVQVPAGRFRALRISPRVWKVRDDDSPRDDRLRGATIWVSDDDARVLLRIRSEVFIGAVTLDLVSRELPS